MIFGRKKIKKTNDSQINYFAWRPFPLKDGRWIWLQLFWREYWSCRSGCGYDYYVDKDKTEV